MGTRGPRAQFTDAKELVDAIQKFGDDLRILGATADYHSYAHVAFDAADIIWSYAELVESARKGLSEAGDALARAIEENLLRLLSNLQATQVSQPTRQRFTADRRVHELQRQLHRESKRLNDITKESRKVAQAIFAAVDSNPHSGRALTSALVPGLAALMVSAAALQLGGTVEYLGISVTIPERSFEKVYELVREFLPPERPGMSLEP